MKLLPLFAVVTTTTCVAAFAPTTNKSSATKTSFRPSHLASSVLDKENNNVPTTVKDDSRKKNAIMMSTAIPFLKCPEVLVESNLAGNVGFDPLGFVKSHDDLMTYREAEIKHARLAMLVRAGLEKVTAATMNCEFPYSEYLVLHFSDTFSTLISLPGCCWMATIRSV